MDAGTFLHQTLFGGVAAAGFAVLFNTAPRALPWCAASGALALAVRTLALGAGWSLETASFAAALVLGSAVQTLQARAGVSRNALGVAGCIPMIPGAFAAKAILALVALTTTAPEHAAEVLTAAAQNLLRVTFTIGAIGTGLAIPTLLLRVRVST